LFDSRPKRREEVHNLLPNVVIRKLHDKVLEVSPEDSAGKAIAGALKRRSYPQEELGKRGTGSSVRGMEAGLEQ